VDMKVRQANKIREIGRALIEVGFVTLDLQARALGLSRSTTWTILKANHKSSGLSAAIIVRMLARPGLPPPVKLKILEYIKEKNAGHYGDSTTRLRKFTARLSDAKVKKGRGGPDKRTRFG
jgi:predicted DNA-binding transcriptional regulator AlpA